MKKTSEDRTSPGKEGGGRSIPDFQHSLPMLLLRCREVVVSRFRPMLRSFGLTEQQWRVLRVLSETRQIEVTQLARRCYILSPSLSRILKDMGGRGLIRRRAARQDQRRSVISISSQGRRLFAIVAPHSEGSYTEIACALGVKKLDTLYALLNHLESSLSKQERPARSGRDGSSG